MTPKPPKSAFPRRKAPAAGNPHDFPPTDPLWDSFFDTQSVSDDFMRTRNQPKMEKC
ncbi:hypothetical protein C7967_101306 [Thalassospira sp. 11-3]|jgi:hypothetical protein|nr:hypothetical protein KO164_2650 [Thalassospira sp. KO164]PXX35922.1 hypothetical protein C7967_101306 [Thalassospira sp. 11-3]SEE48618.1 hypothetical protein SAMN04515623_2673 [Thalassospira permensis]